MLIQAETLINDEGMIPCFDVVSILCDQLNGRLKTIEKFGPSKDMDQNFRTLIYAAPRMEIDELMRVRHELTKLMGKDFILQADTDESAVNKVVSNYFKFADSLIIILGCSKYQRENPRGRRKDKKISRYCLGTKHRL